VFYEYVKLARESKEWEFLFFRWFDFSFYSRPLPPGFHDTPLSERELELIEAHNLSLEQIAWRRQKLNDEGYTLMRFRREYPETWQDPFLPNEQGAWFDVELINRVLGRLPAHTSQQALDVYVEPEPGRRYFIGMDTAGGTGGDYAAIVVLRDDCEVCAVWRSNTASPKRQADMGAQLAGKYRGALVLCEINNFVKEVILEMERLHVNLWRDDKDNYFWTQGGRAGASKVMIYSYAREMVDNQHAVCLDASVSPRLNDPTLAHELLSMREGKTGDIAAPEGMHDDHADAYVLALWCGRRYYTVATAPPKESEVAKYERLQRMTR
jgi:hypothetical protein